MAFTTTTDIDTVMGTFAVRGGTYASDGGSTGGDINTGLHKCHHMVLTPNASAMEVGTNETFPCDGSAVTIVTEANAAGRWLAFGY